MGCFHSRRRPSRGQAVLIGAAVYRPSRFGPRKSLHSDGPGAMGAIGAMGAMGAGVAGADAAGSCGVFEAWTATDGPLVLSPIELCESTACWRARSASRTSSFDWAMKRGQPL